MADVVEIKIKADAGQAKREMKALGSQFGTLGKVATSAEGKFLAAGAAIVAIGAGAVAAGKALVDNAKAVAKNGDEFARMSRVLGTTNKEVQQLSFLAAGARVDFKKLGSGLKRLQRNMLDSTTGNKRMAETFADLGIDVKDADGRLRNVMDVSRDLADEIKKMGKGANATGTLMLLLGRAGTETADVFLKGSEAFDAADDSLRELSGYMSNEAIQASEDYITSTVDLGIAVQGLKNDMGSGLIPVMTTLNEKMTDSIRLGRTLSKTFSESKVGKVSKFVAGLVGGQAKGFLGAAFPKLSAGAVLLNALTQPEAPFIGPPISGKGGGPPGEDDSGGGGGGRSGRLRSAGSRSFNVGAIQDSIANSILGSVGIADAEAAAEHLSGLIDETNAAEQLLADNRKVRAEQESDRMRKAAEDAQLAADIQTQNAAEVFGAVSHFADLAQQAVEDSAFGQTRAGKTAAIAMFAISKAAALAQAAVSTALAIANALTVMPPPVGAALAVGAGIAGGVQIGTIAATSIQGLADGGLAPGVLKSAGLNNHTVIGIRNDEAVIDPQGTSHITAMLGLQRRQMEMGAMGGGGNRPAIVNVSLDGRRLNEGLSPYQTAAIENGRDPAQNARFGLARAS